MASLEIRQARKSFGSIEVVHGVDLQVNDGEFVILVGPSGCGKSTLLRMIAGLEDITSGDIVLDGRIMNALQPRERDIAMVFQSYALYPHMTVAQNMGFALRLSGLARDDIGGKVQSAAEVLGLGALLERKPAQLSGGQRQRVAMGRAIVRNPKLFLFDEPLSNLDAKLRVQMRSEIKELHERIPTTTVYVTHDQIEAMTMADRIVVMNSGHIEQVGPPMELYDRPQTLFVASFLGSPAMNLLHGTLSDDAVVTDGGNAFALGATVPDRHRNRTVTLGIRPENLGLNGTTAPIGQADIRVVEPTGYEMLLTVNMAGESLLMIVRDRRTFTRGETVPVCADPSDFHFFDRETGERIALHD